MGPPYPQPRSMRNVLSAGEAVVFGVSATVLIYEYHRSKVRGAGDTPIGSWAMPYGTMEDS